MKCMERQKDRETEIQKDRQIDIPCLHSERTQTDQKNMLTDKRSECNVWKDVRKTERQKDRNTEKQKNRKTE